MTRSVIAEANTYGVVKDVDIMFKTQAWSARLLFRLYRERGRELLLVDKTVIPVLVYESHTWKPS